MAARLEDDLAAQVERGRKILATDDWDLDSFQEWLTQRANVFAALGELDRHSPADQRAHVAQLIKEILAADGAILARLESRRDEVGMQIAAASKMSRAIGGASRPPSAGLMSRLA